jgi:hypothetical protein
MVNQTFLSASRKFSNMPGLSATPVELSAMHVSLEGEVEREAVEEEAKVWAETEAVAAAKAAAETEAVARVAVVAAAVARVAVVEVAVAKGAVVRPGYAVAQ